ncbi:MAG: sigma-70 family RNA polymerase sigma factor [Actinobacteria bacterium]|nr:sigma-70 family RNA polymerase sigma factor [Actinomycetota bacterium]
MGPENSEAANRNERGSASDSRLLGPGALRGAPRIRRATSLRAHPDPAGVSHAAYRSRETATVEELVELLREGDEAAAPLLVSVLAPSIIDYAVGIALLSQSGPSLSQTELEEVAEAAIERAIKRLQVFDPSRASFPTWVRGFVRNGIRRRQRLVLQQAQLLGSSSGWSDDFDFDLDPTRRSPQTLRVAPEIVGALSEADQQILRLRHVQSLSYAAISARLGVSEDAARQRHARALKRARKLAAASIPPTETLRDSEL